MREPEKDGRLDVSVPLIILCLVGRGIGSREKETQEERRSPSSRLDGSLVGERAQQPSLGLWIAKNTTALHS